MFKKFIAMLLGVTMLCSLCATMAYAEDGSICIHQKKTTQTVSYAKITEAIHQKSVRTFTECVKCGEVFTDKTDTTIEAHSSKDGKTYNYHSGDYHYFYQVCRCSLRINQMRVACTGNPHVAIVLSVPEDVVTE